ncbi:MAG: aspartate carbamoyltransferase regulatory subunit [Candidatus Diapherotrites archaeon]
MKKEIKVTPIKNGTVIDHLPAGTALRVLRFLKLKNNPITIAMNVESKKQGKKDIIFIEDKFLGEKEFAKIALIGKGATMNIIKNHEVKSKGKIEIRDFAEGIIKCINPNCISNAESIKTKFVIKDKPLKAVCYYCQKTMDELEIIESIK